jgi:hypothetical protein
MIRSVLTRERRSWGPKLLPGAIALGWSTGARDPDVRTITIAIAKEDSREMG